MIGIEAEIQENRDFIVDAVVGPLNRMLEFCESPIEKLLLSVIYAQSIVNPWVGQLFCQPGFYIFDVRIQQPAGKYRIDIAVEFKYGDKTIVVAVECDGHDFHERTKEQAKRDKAKDRFLQQQGYLVARFTGSEIYNDAYECFSCVVDLAYSAINR